jgi:hypothetical protein
MVLLDGQSGTASALVETRLGQMPGRQLMIVNYAAADNSLDEWFTTCQ